jgi:DnaJ-class molecular chaperone
MADLYQTLGVKRGDTDDAIRAAYRKLAKKYHPDMNQGKPEAADRFKTISAAYDILSDKDKRGRYDRGEIDADGRETAVGRAASAGMPGGGPWSNADHADPRAHPRGDPFEGIGPDDLDTLFGHGFAGSSRGRDIRYSVTVDFIEAANGTTRRMVLHDGRELDVAIPAGVRNMQTLRLKGLGRRGLASAGDAVVEVTVAPHKFFRREGDDVVMELPITLQEATLGASIEVPTVRGPVRLTIPPGSGSGSRLRLKGRGIGHGHQHVVLTPVLPAGVEPALADFLRTWQPSKPFNPRDGMTED